MKPGIFGAYYLKIVIAVIHKITKTLKKEREKKELAVYFLLPAGLGFTQMSVSH